jgi:uncharacterized protein involved in exopolysaccharide biosynthesis
MNETSTKASTLAAVKTDDQEISFFDLVLALARHKKMIVGLPFVAAVAAAIISFALPNIYRAETRMLPPQQSQSAAAAMLSQLGGMASLAGFAGIKNPNDMYIAMLRSQRVADRLIERFSLKKVYDTDSQEKARKKLETNTAITSGKDGLISIEVQDENKKLVAQIANAYVAELTLLSRTLALTEASQRRIFFERELERSKDNLAAAETSLKRTLDSGGVISVDAEGKAILETVARLRAQVSAKEIQLSSMSAFVTASHPDYQRANEELNSLRAQLVTLENGKSSAASATQTMEKSRGFENIQLLRDIKYHQMLYELLAKQYEVARLDEAKDPAIIQVLDPAGEPERKFKPQRTVIVLLSAVFALFVALAWAMFSEAKRRMLMQPDGATRWAELKSVLRFR